MNIHRIRRRWLAVTISGLYLSEVSTIALVSAATGRLMRLAHRMLVSEARELIQAFVDKIAELNPQLVTFNGNSFDLPVLRNRAMT